jgi:hypothetical protein
MDTSKFLNSIRKIIREEVRSVIKQELTEILTEGLQSTIKESIVTSNTKKPVNVKQTSRHETPVSVSKSKVQFTNNKWADVLNQTDVIREPAGSINSYAELMNENMNELNFTSRDAQNFGMIRNTTTSAPTVMEDPETGKVYDVAPEVQQAMTRDYSALMKAIAAKKGN